MGVGGRLVVDYGTLNGQQQVFADVRDGLPEVGARLTGGVEHAGLGAGEFAGTVQPTLDGFATAWAQVIHACGGAVGGLALCDGIWSKRFRAVRHPLVHGQREQGDE